MEFRDQANPRTGSIDFIYSLTSTQLHAMRGQVANVIAEEAATQLTKEFVKEHGQEVLANIDIRAVANLAMVQAVNELAKAIAGRAT